MNLIQKSVLLLTIIGALTVATAKDKDIFIQGCEDNMQNKSTFASGVAIGYMGGVKDQGLLVLKKLGLPTVTGIDSKIVCRDFLLKMQNDYFKDYNPKWILFYTTQGFVVRNNGYTMDEVKQRVKIAQEALGTLKEKKKY